MKKIERIACYIRVSTQEQKLHGLSLDAQRDKLKEYADRNNLKIVDWYEDEGVSGRKLIKNRPELQRMIHDAEKGLFDRIIFIKLDRFFRSIAEYHECMKIINPVIWTSTEEKYDLSTANGRAFVNMKLTIAELEADQTGERIRLVNEFKVKNGSPLSGKVLFCYTIINDGSGKRIVKNPETRHIMEDALDYVFRCQSKRKTLAYVHNKYDLRISYNTLDRAFRTPLMYGEYRNNPNYLPEEERYLTKEEYDKLQALLTRQVKDYTKREYLYSGLIKCPHCGRRLSGSLARNNGHEYHKYRCHNFKTNHLCDFNKMVNEKRIERLLLDQIEVFFENAKIENARIIEELPVDRNMEIKELQAELDRLNYSWQKGRIKDVDSYDREYDRLSAKIEELKNKEDKIEVRDISKVEEALAGNWRDIYDALDRHHRQMFWRSFIESIEIEWTTEVKRITNIVFF